MKKNYVNVLWVKAHPKYAYNKGDRGIVLADRAPSLLKEGFIIPVPDEDENKNTLPEDLPARDVLFEAGYDTIEKIKKAGESLIDVKGIGKGTLKQLEAWFEEHK